MSNVKIRILDSQQKIENNILKVSETEIKNKFQAAKPKIESRVKEIIVRALSESPEIVSLKSDTLKYDFGLVIDPTSDIIYAIANSTYVYFKNFRFNKKSVNSVMSIYIQPSDFSNLLSLAVANVITEKGELLPWLEWLLTAGDAIVIAGYSVEYGPSPNSRTGGAIMFPDGMFRVDPQYSGTQSDNFITRALDKYSNEIGKLVGDTI